eukprot:TRINITY_DN3521_c0_g1_i4.p2 TRINITY_DN3521_c0_g1~~TRINITY_DN3521_c0_g1_i4.p2  ORF type:complete len:230 (+),score=52.87 TRINITY_DN3521_c0_g1_i4:162-851(+)
MSGSSVRAIANSVRQVSSDPGLLQFLDFLDTSICSTNGCYKEYSDKLEEESAKAEKLKEEHLELKSIEVLFKHILKKVPAGSELELFYNSILPYLELLQESKPDGDFEAITVESEEEINSIVAETVKVSAPEVIERAQREVNLSLQTLLAKRREKIELEVNSTLPPELLNEGFKCSKLLSGCVESKGCKTGRNKRGQEEGGGVGRGDMQSVLRAGNCVAAEHCTRAEDW